MAAAIQTPLQPLSLTTTSSSPSTPSSSPSKPNHVHAIWGYHEDTGDGTPPAPGYVGNLERATIVPPHAPRYRHRYHGDEDEYTLDKHSFQIHRHESREMSSRMTSRSSGLLPGDGEVAEQWSRHVPNLHLRPHNPPSTNIIFREPSSSGTPRPRSMRPHRIVLPSPRQPRSAPPTRPSRHPAQGLDVRCAPK